MIALLVIRQLKLINEMLFTGSQTDSEIEREGTKRIV